MDNETLNFGDLVGLGCVHGNEQRYPTADVHIVIKGRVYMRAELVDQLYNLVQSVSKSYAVVTRSEAKGLQPLPDLHSDNH